MDHQSNTPVVLPCGGSVEPLETIPGQAIPRRTGRASFGSYGAGLFEHRHVALSVAPPEVRRVRNLLKNQCMVEIARFGQNPEDPEDD